MNFEEKQDYAKSIANFEQSPIIENRDLNVIGVAYYNSDEVIKAHFIDLASRKALANGSEQKRFRRIFQETHAILPIANVYTYFLHAAHEVWGINFDFRVQARSKDAKTITTVHEGKTLAVTIETL